MRIAIKRAYEAASPDDGQRILTERLWPRGVSKDQAAIDWWPKDVAPSPELRKWYSHDVDKWPEFQRRYRAELDRHEELIEGLLARILEGPVTLVYGSKDTEHNSSVVLAEYLTERLAKDGATTSRS